MDGHASGLGAIHHRPFPMASGDVTPDVFDPATAELTFAISTNDYMKQWFSCRIGTLQGGSVNTIAARSSPITAPKAAASDLRIGRFLRSRAVGLITP